MFQFKSLKRNDPLTKKQNEQKLTSKSLGCLTRGGAISASTQGVLLSTRSTGRHRSGALPAPGAGHFDVEELSHGVGLGDVVALRGIWGFAVDLLLAAAEFIDLKALFTHRHLDGKDKDLGVGFVKIS